MSVLSKQVGGDHYQKYRIQPIELLKHTDFISGNILKYVLRDKNENDLEKALQYVDFGEKLNKKIDPSSFIQYNELDDIKANIIISVFMRDWGQTRHYIQKLERVKNADNDDLARFDSGTN
jgi:hypothetical protein